MSVNAIVGPMFSGKTSELIRRMKKCSKGEVLAFKPEIDNRSDCVQSHDGETFPTFTVKHPSDILNWVTPETRVVGIDEIQFFDDFIVAVVKWLVRSNIQVIFSGLDYDFKGDVFSTIPKLLTCADKIDTYHSVCSVCGNKNATRTQRLVNGEPASRDDPLVLIGASNFYEPRCVGCHKLKA